jgi:HEPN domain-containing protein
MIFTDSLDVKKWIRYAQNDYDLALLANERFRPPMESVCYLCQQSAEKILKAYTIAKGSQLIKTHALKELLDKCVQYSADFSMLKQSCIDLTPYISLGRYPATIELTDYLMRQALKNAEKILAFTKSKLEELGFVSETEPPQN